MSDPRVSVVCLSYGRPHLLHDALASVTRQTLAPYETIVVDNRSDRSDEIAAVTATFPSVTLIANSKNLGFTGGMNIGLSAATGDYIVLTEDDIVLSDTTLEALIHAFTPCPHVGILGGVMRNRNTDTIRCAGGNVQLGVRYQLQILHTVATPEGNADQPYPVSYLPGAFLAAHSDVWRRLGGFRDRFFAYLEDVDLCIRAAKAGLALLAVPGATIWHVDPPANQVTPVWLKRLKYQNLLRLYLLNATLAVLPGFIARYALWSPLRHFLNFRKAGWHEAVAIVKTLLELPALLRERGTHPTLPVNAATDSHTIPPLPGTRHA